MFNNPFGNNFGNMNNKTVNNTLNPMQLLNIYASKNPQMKPIIDKLSSGENPKTIFESLCKEKGINPNDFISNLFK